MSRKLTLLGALYLGAFMAVTNAQTGNKQPGAGEVQESYRSLLDRVSALPAEYKADLGFELLDLAGPAISLNQRKKLLDDVFHSAHTAIKKFPITQADGHRHPDTLSGVTANMLGMSKVDELDIQARSIDRAFGPLPSLAAQMFEEMVVPHARAACSDPAVENVNAYYAIAEKILDDQRATALHPRDKSELLSRMITSLEVPAQIAPAAELIRQVHLSPDQFQQATSDFAAALDSIDASDREITAADERGQLSEAIDALAGRMSAAGESPVRLLAAYRRFLVRSLSRESCADDSLDRGDMASEFNKLLGSSTPAKSGVDPLSAKELASTSAGAEAGLNLVPFDPQIMAKINRIRTAQEARVAEEYRTGKPGEIQPESNDVQNVIQFALSYNSDGKGCGECDFDAKGAMFMLLADTLPAGSQLEAAINAEVGFLSYNDMETKDPIAWLTPFKELLNVSRKPGDTATQALRTEVSKNMTPWGTPSPGANEIRKILRSAPDPIIQAYAMVEDFLHPSYLTPLQRMNAK